MKYGKRNRCLIPAAVICILLFGLPAFADQEAVVSRGVFLQGMDLGGMTVDQVTAAVDGRISELSQTQVTLQAGDSTTVCTLADLGLSWRNREIVSEIFHLGATGNIVRRYKDQKDLEHTNKQYSLEFTTDPAKVQGYVQTLSAFDTQPVNATIYTRDDLTPGVDGGTDGITVDTAQAAQDLTQLVEGWNGSDALSLELPVTRVTPDVSYDDLALISDVLGTATTDYSASSYGRAINVENGCSKISGTLLYPGEYFSLTAAVTPFTAENGYEQAPSYEENRVVNSYGGGICQVSTTLYNAVLKAELEVTARSNHTMVVAYVPLSKDAAIAEGSMDMCFVNNLEDPIYIIGYCYGGQITFTIYGHETRPANRTLEFESRTISTVEPTQAKFFPNASQPVGYISQTQSPHTGYTAELWKNIYIDGVLSDSVQINSSYYTAVGTIYDVGIMSDNAAVSQAVQTAIASNDLAAIQAAIANASQIAQQAQSEAAAQQAQTDANGNQVQLEYTQEGDVDESVVVIP